MTWSWATLWPSSRSLCFQFLLPVIQISLMCLCIGADPKGIQVAVVNNETAPNSYSQSLLSFIDNSSVEQVEFYNKLCSSWKDLGCVLYWCFCYNFHSVVLGNRPLILQGLLHLNWLSVQHSRLPICQLSGGEVFNLVLRSSWTSDIGFHFCSEQTE